MGNKTIYCGYESGDILAWSLKEDILIDHYKTGPKAVSTLSPLNPRVLLSVVECSIQCWDTSIGQVEHSLTLPYRVDYLQVAGGVIYMVLSHYAIL